MSPRDIEAEARDKRERIHALLTAADELETVAKGRTTLFGIVFEKTLERHVEKWEKTSCWATLDDEMKREQGKVLRSRELLEYLRGAEDQARKLRAEAERLAGLLETAANDGRISRV